ncbi:hypothetical protein AgCh_013959 [Apium graveolens]
MAKYSRIVCFIVVSALVVNLMVEQGEALTCSSIGPSIVQCSPYARGAFIRPSVGCCNAVRSIYAQARTTQDRRTLCNCLKRTASSVRGIQLSSIAAIPQRCGLRVSFPTNPNINCNTVN